MSDKLFDNEIAAFKAVVSAIAFVAVVVVLALVIFAYNRQQFDIEAIKAGYEQRSENGRVLWAKPRSPAAELSPDDL